MLNRILVVFSIIIITIFYAFYQNRTLDSQLKGNIKILSVLAKMPNSPFQKLDKSYFEIENLFLKNKSDLVVVHFWGTWCAPCEAELPELLKFISTLDKKNIKFLLVAVNDDLVRVKNYIKKHNVLNDSKIEWLIDNSNIHRDIYGTTRVPETYVFSSDKSNLRKFIGPQRWNNPMFFQTFDELVLISTRKL